MSAGVDHGAVREETPTTYYDGLVRIPGYGDAPERCRDYKPVGFCDDGHTILGRSSCGTRYCPDHWRDWCEGAVINTVARLAAYREAQNGAGKRLLHVVASPPQDRRYSRRELWDTRSDAYDAFEAAGGRGGVSVTHPYRTTETATRLYKSAVEEGKIPGDYGKWRFLRDLAEDFPGGDWDELEELIEPAPHYHGLVPSRDLDGSDAPGGWVVENVRSMDPLYVDPDDVPAVALLDENQRIVRGPNEAVRAGFEDMVATVYYILTHGAVQEERNTTTYFGEVHPNSFDPEEAVGAETWARIQAEAEAAVKGYDVEAVGEDGVCDVGPEECPHEDCEAPVYDLEHLPDRLDDDDWTAEIRAQKGGRRRLKRLMGVLAYWEGRTDRPPPRAATSKARYREWLEERGNALTVEPVQARLASVMG